MTSDQRKQFFDNFLVKNGCYDSYYKNIKLSPGIVMEKLLSQTSHTSMISAAFYWTRTPEGPAYWNGINNKWEALFQKNNK